jgi:hypothetical protein
MKARSKEISECSREIREIFFYAVALLLFLLPRGALVARAARKSANAAEKLERC